MKICNQCKISADTTRYLKVVNCSARAFYEISSNPQSIGERNFRAGWVGWLVCHRTSAPKTAGSNPAQVSGVLRCRKSTAAMSYDYTVCKRSLECLAWVFSAKLNSSVGSRRQSSDASLWGGHWEPKLFVAVGIACMWCRAKK
ncbi:hypothetical protein TNCV_3748531 [Trichonephila clavipes]|nr:hypothetical protein TNCV_3748531 [Trichonephila clavipes]